MKILIITDEFLPSFGGVQRHTYTLARYLSKLSHEVHIATSPSKNIKLDLRFDKELGRLYNIEVYRDLPRPRTNLPFCDEAKFVLDSLNIAKYINNNLDKYNIIHYHGGHYLFMRYIQNNSTLVTTLHGTAPACRLQSPKQCKTRSIARCAICNIRIYPRNIIIMPFVALFYYFYYQFSEKSLRNIRKIICVSNYVKNFIKEKLNLNNLITIHNFIDYRREILPHLKSSTQCNIRNHFHLPHDSKIITYFGRLAYWKGVDLLLNAFKKIPNKKKNHIFLLIGGDGPQRKKLEDNARVIDNVVFTGFLDREIQLSTISQSDIFVHPSRYPDAFPTTILEAMAIGKPIIATNIGGIPESIVDGKGGFIVSPKAVEIAKKISILLNNKEFKVKAENFNLKWVQRFDIKQLGPKIIDLYNKVCSNT